MLFFVLTASLHLHQYKQTLDYVVPPYMSRIDASARFRTSLIVVATVVWLRYSLCLGYM
jgi:hypothetical protein